MAGSSLQTITSTTSIGNDHRGLTTAEAQVRLKQFGPNAVVEEAQWETNGGCASPD